MITEATWRASDREVAKLVQTKNEIIRTGDIDLDRLRGHVANLKDLFAVDPDNPADLDTSLDNAMTAYFFDKERP